MSQNSVSRKAPVLQITASLGIANPRMSAKDYRLFPSHIHKHVPHAIVNLPEYRACSFVSVSVLTSTHYSHLLSGQQWDRTILR